MVLICAGVAFATASLPAEKPPSGPIATVLRNSKGQAVASVTLVGPTPQVLPRVDALSVLLRERVREWQTRSLATPREPI